MPRKVTSHSNQTLLHIHTILGKFKKITRRRLQSALKANGKNENYGQVRKKFHMKTKFP
jgi:hypothetical protein